MKLTHSRVTKRGGVMLKYSKIILFLLIFCFIASSASAAGVWDSEGVMHVFEGQKFLVGTDIIRITAIVEGEVSFDIEKFGKIIGSGAISAGNPSYALENEVWIEYNRPSDYYRYGKGAYIEPFAWVDGKITNHNFPNHMTVGGFYDIFVSVQNTGSKNAKFRVELTQKGDFDRARWMYRLPSGEYAPKILEIDFPSQFITVPYESSGTANYVKVEPRRGPGKEWFSYYREGEIVINLYYEDNLIDSIDLGKLIIDLTRSGYIKKISAPSVMIRDMEYVIDVEVVNNGYTAQGISKTFNLEQVSPVFRMDPLIKRDEIPSFSSKIWKVTVRPIEIGEQELKFKFTYNKGFSSSNIQVLDELSMPVKVIGGYSTYVEQISIPDDIQYGDTFDVGVNLHNYGNTREVVLRLKAPDLIEVPLTKVIKLEPTSTYSTVFTLKADSFGKLPITVEILPRQTVITPGKNYDPYAEETYIISAKSAYVDIFNGFIPAESAAKEPEVIVKFVEPPLPKVVAEEIQTQAKEPIRINVLTALLFVLVVVLSLVLLKILFSVKKRK